MAGGTVHVGRSRENDLILPEDGYDAASGRHALLTMEGGQWRVRDLDSTNGTYLNGRRIDPGTSNPLGEGDELGFGGEPTVRVGIGRNRGPIWLVAGLLAVLLVVAGLGLRSLLRLEEGFEAIAESVTERVFLLATEEDGNRVAAGTGFLVHEDGWLATNAHVAELLREGRSRGARAIAIRSDRRNAVFEIGELRTHPGYVEKEFRNDVALARLEALAMELSPLELASGNRVSSLRRGARLGAIGFPATRTDLELPRARLRVDVLEERREGFLGVGLDISPGMSGSPIVDRTGAVVGVVVGGHFDEELNWGLTPEPLAELLRAIP